MVKLAETVVEAAGPGIEVAADLHTRLDKHSAIRLARDLEPLHLMWLEEPIPPENIHFFVGLEDPVFSQDQTLAFARQLGGCAVTGYPGHGHLLFLSCKESFQDIFAFFEGRACVTSGRVQLAKE